MKRTLILLFFLNTSLAVVGQKCKVTVLTEKADVTLNGILVGHSLKITDEISNQFLVVAKKGMMTYGEKNEEILKKGPTYNIQLSEIKKPAEGMKSRKIEFGGFVDSGNLSKATVSYSYYGVGFMASGWDLADPNFAKPIPKLMSDWGFSMIGKNTVFDVKDDSPDYVLAGEIMGFGKDTRGSGHQVSVLINWSLLEVETKKVVYTGITGGFSDSKKAIGLQEEFKLSLKDATVGLMCDPKFQEITLKKSESSTSERTGVVTKLPEISSPKFTGYSEMVKKVVGSVVTVKNGNSHGSGFLISKSGYLVTNNHVVSGSDTFEIIFNNGFNMEAVLVKSDNFRDVALLKITSGAGYTPLAINRNTEELEIGAEVIAVGTPADIALSQTVTKGIISGKRELEDSQNRKNNFIQTDVTLNSGNSGGPLLNMKGEVVGIVVSKLVGGSTEGLGFAIPVGEAIDKLNIDFE